VSPARKKPAKKTSKSTGKKPSKRGVVSKGATSRQKANRNQELLQGDLSFYNQADKKNYSRRTKGNKQHPRGVPLYTLIHEKGVYHTLDNSISLTDAEYERLANNPDAIPRYTPLKKDGKIVRYRNTRTGDVVTPYYRFQIFGKAFNDIQDEETRVRSELYLEAGTAQRHAAQSRHHNLAESYQIIHNDMNLNEIYRSADFQQLVGELVTYHYRAYGINPENIMTAQNLGYNITEEEAKRALGSMNGYQQVLASLGRRLPSDNHPVGDSDPNYINDVVKKYWAKQHGEG
jgi:hypothetical protein